MFTPHAHTSYLHLARSEVWCWSEERGILTELPLCYRIICHSTSLLRLLFTSLHLDWKPTSSLFPFRTVLNVQCLWSNFVIIRHSNWSSYLLTVLCTIVHSGTSCWLDRALVLFALALSLASDSISLVFMMHWCYIDLFNFFITFFTVHFSNLSLVGLALDLVG